MSQTKIDKKWMQYCLELAGTAEPDVPIAALIVNEDGLVSEATNRKERDGGATYHAELLSIDSACKKLKRWRLTDCTLYVNLEPCSMCAGAILQARIKRLVFATPDPKAGACGSLYNILQDQRLNHQCEISSGLLQKDAAQMITNFFQRLRN